MWVLKWKIGIVKTGGKILAKEQVSSSLNFNEISKTFATSWIKSFLSSLFAYSHYLKWLNTNLKVFREGFLRR